MGAKNKFEGKKVTINQLAEMVNNGFKSVDERFNEVDKRFDRMDNRLDRIENIILTDHRNRLEKVEDRVRVLETQK